MVVGEAVLGDVVGEEDWFGSGAVIIVIVFENDAGGFGIEGTIEECLSWVAVPGTGGCFLGGVPFVKQPNGGVGSAPS